MIYMYSFCYGNSVHAVAEYQRRFLNRRIPTQRVFTWVYQTLQDTGTLPGIRIAAERDVNERVNEEEGIVQMVQSSPRAPWAVSATSQIWQFCWEAGILRVA